MTNINASQDDGLVENRKMYINFLQVMEGINQRQKKVLTKFGITHAQYNILRILKGAFPSALNLKQIQARMVFGSPDITRLIDRLINKNLVERNSNILDKRKIDVQLSGVGLEKLEELNPKMEKTVHNFFKDIVSQEEAVQMNGILERIKQSLVS